MNWLSAARGRLAADTEVTAHLGDGALADWECSDRVGAVGAIPAASVGGDRAVEAPAVRRSLLPLGAVFAVVAMLAGCATTPRHTTPSPAPAAGASAGSASAGSVEQYAAVIKANSDRSDHESDGRVRADLATQSSTAADACLALDAQAAACQYGKAVATGMEARAHPTKAVGLLNSMLQSLNSAEAADPNYDKAGPSRVRALVLIRAPGWPLGPGDTDAGLAAARKAVSLQPDYPPNVLALAEALSKSGDAKGSHASYQRALELAQAAPAGPERNGWVHDAQEGLAQK